MSIVICAVHLNKTMYLASDCRAIKNGITNDDFKKIFEIRPYCYYAITGTAEPGLWFLDRVKKREKARSTKELIRWADKDFEKHGFPTLTVTIAGKDEKNNFFIWQKNNAGQQNYPEIDNNGVTFSISSNCKIPLFVNHFSELVKNLPIDVAMSETIKYASTIDDSISSKYEMYCLE